MKILVIDDEELVLEMLTKILIEFDHTIVTASDGQDGLDKYFINPSSFDLIIADIKMPNIDGFEFTEKLFLKNCDVPLIFMTGQSEIPDDLNFNYLGLLRKPFEFKVLLELMDKVKT